MEPVKDMITLSQMLEQEWRGGQINRQEAGRLAESLLPVFPELRVTLQSVKRRMHR